MAEEASATDTEQLLWTCKECYLYQIPPLKNESGHRANDWDVNKWLWQGSLRVACKGNMLNVTLHDATSGELFAACPAAEQGSSAIDQVVDSSRYFVLRLDDGKGKHAFMGMGFRDRALAYDFKATIEDHWKGVAREKEADEMEAKLAAEPLKDLSLKDGETLSIKVNVPGASGKPRAPRPKPEGGAGLMLPPPPGPGLLAPPPKAGALAPPPPPSARAAAPPAKEAAAPAAPPAPAAQATDDDDGFGDFSTAANPSAGADNDDDDGFGDFTSS